MHLRKLFTALQARGYGAGTHMQLETRATAGWTGSPGSAAQPPAQDGFYTMLDSSDIAQLALGDVIKSRQVGGFPDNSNVEAYQVVYRSENSHGLAVGALTTIIVPSNNDQSHVVVFPQAEDSSCIDCVTSHRLLAHGLGSQINSFLNAGYVLSIPDHEGFNSSFAAGLLEGKLTLDSIRALQKSRHLTSIDNDDYIVVGYSGGSIPAGWAAELHESYAPDLNIRGFSMGGLVASIVAVMKKVNKSLTAGFVPCAFLGLASEYPELWTTIHKEVPANKLGSLLQTRRQCSAQNIMQFIYQDFFTNFRSGQQVLGLPVVQTILEANTMGKSTPRVPMFIYNGVQDQIVPVQSVDEVVKYYCRNGASLTYRRGANSDHFSMETDTAPELLQWVSKVFNGYNESGCTYKGASMPDI